MSIEIRIQAPGDGDVDRYIVDSNTTMGDMVATTARFWRLNPAEYELSSVTGRRFNPETKLFSVITDVPTDAHNMFHLVRKRDPEEEREYAARIALLRGMRAG